MSPLDPPPRRKIFFMLTPLVDVMFLLLIFFMLSSQTSPYALLGISAPASAGTPPPAPAPAAAEPANQREILVSIADGFVRFNGERVEMADLRRVIARYQAQGIDSAMVLTGRTARVQDVVTVLEAFQDASFGAARLMLQTGAEP